MALLTKGSHPASVWDGLFLAAGELLARQPGIVGLHCVTSINALHFGYETQRRRDDAAFPHAPGGELPGACSARRCSDAAGWPTCAWTSWRRPKCSGDTGEAIADSLRRRRQGSSASRRAGRWPCSQRDPQAVRPLMATARRLVFAKGNELARLQVQLRRAGGLLPRQPGLASELRRLGDVPTARQRRSRQSARRPVAGSAGDRVTTLRAAFDLVERSHRE